VRFAPEFHAVEVRFFEARAGKVRAAEVDGLPVLLAVAAPDNRDAGLHVGSGLALGWFRPGRIGGWRRWPRLAGVIADKRGQHLHHCGVVAGRVPGDAFQGIDAPNAHLELSGAELVDRLGVAVAHLPLLSELDSTPCRFDSLLRHCDSAFRHCAGHACVPYVGQESSHGNDDCAASTDQGTGHGGIHAGSVRPACSLGSLIRRSKMAMQQAGGLAELDEVSGSPARGPAAAARQLVTQTVTPPPPSFETCKTVGSEFICGTRTPSYGPDDTGIVCGSSASAFDISTRAASDMTPTCHLRPLVLPIQQSAHRRG
jgi:hypothetical protein